MVSPPLAPLSHHESHLWVAGLRIAEGPDVALQADTAAVAAVSSPTWVLLSGINCDAVCQWPAPPVASAYSDKVHNASINTLAGAFSTCAFCLQALQHCAGVVTFSPGAWELTSSCTTCGPNSS